MDMLLWFYEVTEESSCSHCNSEVSAFTGEKHSLLSLKKASNLTMTSATAVQKKLQTWTVEDRRKGIIKKAILGRWVEKMTCCPYRK